MRRRDPARAMAARRVVADVIDAAILEAAPWTEETPDGNVDPLLPAALRELARELRHSLPERLVSNPKKKDH